MCGELGELPLFKTSLYVQIPSVCVIVAGALGPVEKDCCKTSLFSWKDLALLVSKKKPNIKSFFSKEEICQLSPLNKCENEKKIVVYS